MKRVIAVFIIILLVNMAACSSDMVNRDAGIKIFYADYDNNAKNFITAYLKEHKKSSGNSIILGQEDRFLKSLIYINRIHHLIKK